jgi:hypothetical protein
MSLYDWNTIKQRWMDGETQTAIADSPGTPTRQAISKKIEKEGWERDKDRREQIKALPIVKNNHTKATKEIVEYIVSELESGLNVGTICLDLGIGKNTLKRWRDSDPEFSTMVYRAMANRDKGYLKRLHIEGLKNPVWSEKNLIRSPIQDEFKVQEKSVVEFRFSFDRDPAE